MGQFSGPAGPRIIYVCRAPGAESLALGPLRRSDPSPILCVIRRREQTKNPQWADAS